MLRVNSEVQVVFTALGLFKRKNLILITELYLMSVSVHIQNASVDKT